MAELIKRDNLRRRQNRYGYIFTAPFIIGSIFAIIYPVILSIAYSLGKIIPQTIGYKIDFVAFENFKTLFTVDPTYTKQLLETLRTTLLNVPVVVIFSFFLACTLNASFRGRGLARTILFLPMILFSRAVLSTMSGDVVSRNLEEKSSTGVAVISGAFTEFLEVVGVNEGITSLLSSSVENITQLLSLSVIPTIIILAGLQSVSRSLYEAAFVEGATAWEVLWKISLPIVSPLLLVSVVYCVVDSFTNTVNPILGRVRTECFKEYNFGLGSAMAWAYLLIVFAIVALVYLVLNRFVSYDA